MPKRYSIDVAFQTDLKDTPENAPDGLYYLMEWGIAYCSDETWAQVPIKHRTNGDRGFGKADLRNGLGVSAGDELTLNVFCSNKDAEDTDLARIDWVRCAFRPAHNVAPNAPNLQTSLLVQDGDTDALLKGIKMSDVPVPGGGVSVGIDRDFPIAFAGVEQHLEPEPTLALQVPSETQLFRLEFTVFLKATLNNGKSRSFVSDPEIITGRRGGG